MNRTRPILFSLIVGILCAEMLGLMGRWAHHAIALQLAWNPSPTANVRYNLYFGPAHGFYTNRLDCGTNLSINPSIQQSGVYYFVVTATNAFGESDFSNEIIATNRPPITNLLISLSFESSQVLTGSWSSISNFQFQLPNPSSNQFFRARLSAALTNL